MIIGGLDKMKDLIRETILFEGGITDVDELAQELYNDEQNFNNADKTSRQRCYQEHEIVSLINEVLEE